MIAQAHGVPTGYKQTEVGVIPEDWGLQRLGEGIHLTSGHHVLAQHCNSDGHGVAYITGPADFPDGKIQHTKFTTRPGTICRPNDILVTVKGSGAGTLVLSDAAYCISRQLMAVRVDTWNTRFVYCSLLRDASLFGAAATGLIPGLSRGDILNKVIPLPPTLAEQEAIAEALGDADALIESLEQLVAKKRHLKQAAMQQLLTGKKRLPGFEGEWDEVQANEVGTFRGGVGFPLRLQGRVSGDFPFFKVSDMSNPGNEFWLNVANNYVDEPVRRQLGAPAIPADSIVFAKVGGAIFLERKRLLAHPSCLDNNMSAFVPNADGVDHRFMHYVFLSINLGDLVSTTALPALSSSVLGSIPFLLPETPEQVAIAEVLSDMDTEIEAIEAKLAKARQIKQGMMQELLTGRTRLV